MKQRFLMVLVLAVVAVLLVGCGHDDQDSHSMPQQLVALKVLFNIAIYAAILTGGLCWLLDEFLDIELERRGRLVVFALLLIVFTAVTYLNHGFPLPGL